MIRSEHHITITVDGVAAQILQNNREIDRKLRDIMQIGVSFSGIAPADEPRMINTDNLVAEYQSTSPFRPIPQITFRSISPYPTLQEAQRIEALLNRCITESLEEFQRQLKGYLQEGIRTK